MVCDTCDTTFNTAIHAEFMLQGLYTYLANLTNTNNDSNLVLMVDALDVWFQLSPTVVIKHFNQLNTDKVVLGADKSCWPNDWHSVSRLQLHLPQTLNFFPLIVCMSKCPRVDSSQGGV